MIVLTTLATICQKAIFIAYHFLSEIYWQRIKISEWPAVRAYLNYIPDFDSEVSKRYKKACLFILGKTNTPKFGLVAYKPEAFGQTRNPWNTALTPGSSSGGPASGIVIQVSRQLEKAKPRFNERPNLLSLCITLTYYF